MYSYELGRVATLFTVIGLHMLDICCPSNVCRGTHELSKSIEMQSILSKQTFNFANAVKNPINKVHNESNKVNHVKWCQLSVTSFLIALPPPSPLISGLCLDMKAFELGWFHLELTDRWQELFTVH